MNQIGIVAALPAEARCLTRNKVLTNKIIPVEQNLLMVCGMGAENASAAASQLIEAGATHLISWGTAGALSTTAKPGDLLIPEIIISDRASALETDHNWVEKLSETLADHFKLHNSPLIQSSEIIVNTDQKSQLQTTSGAIAVDMESYVIGTLAKQKRLPFVAIRSIVDSSEESIPTSALMSVDLFGRTKPIPLIVNLLKKPTDIPKLIRLGNHFKLAQKTLQKVSDSVGTTFAL